MAAIPGVLFDFDGVIVDSLSLHLRAWQITCQNLLKIEFSEALSQSIVGLATREIAARLVATAGAACKDTALVVQEKNRWLRQHVHEVPLLPGVHEMFDHLRTQKIPFGIASNASRQYLIDTVSKFDLKVPVVLGLEDYQSPKPSPEPYLKLAKMLSITFTRHREVIVFEDSTHGLRAAVRAGMHPIGVTTTHSAEELISAGAKATCTDLAQARVSLLITTNS